MAVDKVGKYGGGSRLMWWRTREGSRNVVKEEVVGDCGGGGSRRMG